MTLSAKALSFYTELNTHKRTQTINRVVAFASLIILPLLNPSSPPQSGNFCTSSLWLLLFSFCRKGVVVDVASSTI